MTKVVLRADVSGVGKKGDILDLADGFARNYLVPRGQALVASAGIEAQANAMRRSRDVKDGREREAAEQVARTLVPAVIALKAKTSGSQGKLFGSVTTADIVEAVAAQTGITLDKRDIHLNEHVRTLGTHQAQVKLHADVQFTVTIEVQRG
ncbi:MAG TPA: 50S ribosomal protein L9 [Acidimicrobiales bacterium]|nr:50S ribosomal protein L9 [Acidimicrobiales bacterium]